MENNNPLSNPPGHIPETKIETKSHLDKLAEIFLPEDLDSIGSRIYNEIIIPVVLKTAGDIIHRSIDMIFGTNYSPNTSPSKQTVDSNWVTYSSQYPAEKPSNAGITQVIPVRSGVYDYKIVRFKTVEDAQQTLNNMRAVIQNTGSCSVGKYLDFCRASTIPEDYNYGWVNLSSVKLQNLGGEFPYRMVLPPTIALQGRNTDIFI